MKICSHFLLLCFTAGLAYAASTEHLRPLICFPLNGLAIGLALSFVVRLFLGC